MTDGVILRPVDASGRASTGRAANLYPTARTLANVGSTDRTQTPTRRSSIECMHSIYIYDDIPIYTSILQAQRVDSQRRGRWQVYGIDN